MRVQKFTPDTMNIELTTACPLRCPQCYCSLTEGKHIDLQTAIHWIQEGGAYGVKDVMLSGGETLCYPHIYEVVSAARKYCGTPNVALSGYNFNNDVLGKLIESGVGGIYISLNGSTEEINAQTRDGYELAISALQLLKDNNFSNTYINWVMHSNNADDFDNVVAFAEKYNVKGLVIMALKPDSNNVLLTVPSKKQMQQVLHSIKSHTSNTLLAVESCYSPMLALQYDTKLFGNINVGKNKGCRAGRHGFSVSVDGKLSPCRHLEYFEAHTKLEDYWNSSEVLHRIRNVDNEKKAPCAQCHYSDYCRHCLAINAKINGEPYIGNMLCPLFSGN